MPGADFENSEYVKIRQVFAVKALTNYIYAGMIHRNQHDIA